MLRQSTKRLIFLCVLLGLIQAGAVPERPNIIIILADDLGYGDPACYNPASKIPTPHIDRLAAEGLRCTDAHSAAGTCTPARYGLLTGINPARTGVRNTLLQRGKPIIEAHETTIASLLRDAGYATHMVGKWHLGFDMNLTGRRPTFDFSRALTGGPLDCGFDSFFGIHSSPGAQPYFFIEGREPVRKPSAMTDGIKGAQSKRDTWVKGRIAPGYEHRQVYSKLCDAAVNVIESHAATGAAQPFFLYYALAAPHAPWLPADSFLGKSGAGRYGDFVAQLDTDLGRVCDALERTDQAANTLIVFTSDNGPKWEAEDIARFGHRAAGSLRGGKAQPYEGGHRVPFVVRWPARIAPGGTTGATINATDFFATFTELLGIDRAHKYPHAAPDSHSFLQALYAPQVPLLRPPMINTFDAYREGDWKLIASRRGQGSHASAPADFKLYNLAEDLGETKDLSARHPEQSKAMFLEYKKFMNNRRLK